MKNTQTETTPSAPAEKSAHTPGSWSWCKQDTGKIAVFSDSEYHQRICEMDDFTTGMGPISDKGTGNFGNRPTGTFGHEADADRREANSRLIAASPELLSACKKLITGCESYLEAQGHALQISGMIATKRAIAKAEGAQ